MTLSRYHRQGLRFVTLCSRIPCRNYRCTLRIRNQSRPRNWLPPEFRHHRPQFAHRLVGYCRRM